ncbi:hypothetical protein PVAP13_5NG484816 [Panicum virgatum]|uniref:Uncharacterized protein n=1 Tax=Panicum virgatum TaxID=38727 RepID=A0A8T0RZU6_PANVG|nr:hypothetical protein PVAP13_5NG484816 [Panicum virgatum]
MLHLPELARVGSASAQPAKEQIHIGQHPGPTVQWDARKPSPGSLPPSSPSPLPFSRSLRRGSDPPQHRTAASTSGAGAAGEIRGHPLPRVPPEWPPPAADRERRRRRVQDPDPVGGRGRDRPHRDGGRGVRALPAGHQGPRPRLARLPRRRLRAPGRALLHQAPRQGGRRGSALAGGLRRRPASRTCSSSTNNVFLLTAARQNCKRGQHSPLPSPRRGCVQALLRGVGGESLRDNFVVVYELLVR